MKGFTGASLLSMALGLASIVHGEEAKANNMNTANMANTANMVAMPNMANMPQAVALTEKGPHGGWKVQSGHFGHRGQGGGGGSGAAAGGKCGKDETKCGDFCADLETNKNFCGSCDEECPWGASCDGGYCYCDEAYTCVLGDTCVDSKTTNNACGEWCEACPWPQVCSDGHCSCPKTAKPDFCPYENGIAAHCVDKKTDDYNCGACNSPCPQYNQEFGFGDASCENGNCECDDSMQELCLATEDFGDICVDYLTNDNFCGISCGDAIACGEGSSCINGKCSNPCQGLACGQGGPTLCAIDSGATCYCGITATGPSFCIANFETCAPEDACDYDEECNPGSICFTNVCGEGCNVKAGVCLPVDATCNDYGR